MAEAAISRVGFVPRAMALSMLQHRQCPVHKLYSAFHRSMVITGSSFPFGRRGKQNAGRFSWNLSLECLQDKHRAECSVGVEMRPKATSSMSRDRDLKQGVVATSDWSDRLFSEDQENAVGTAADRVLSSMRRLQTRAIQGVATTFSSESLPGNLCLGIVAVVLLVSLMKLKNSWPRKGQAVKTRILRSQWFKESKQDSRSRNTGARLEGVTPLAAQRVRGVLTRRDKPTSLFQRHGRSRTPFVESSAAGRDRDTTRLRPGSLHIRNWSSKDETDLKQRVEELRKSVQAAEANRKAAMRALAEERQRSLELEVKISRQKETALSLEEEVRVLKESHEALLNSLRKKYSSSVAARAAAALLYQNWEGSDNDLQSVHSP